MRALTAAVALSGALALDNGIASRPGLGWNSDYCTGCSNPSSNGFGGENFVAYIAEYMAKVPQKGAAGGRTLQNLGFHYVNMDASWDLKERDANGRLVPDPALWPSGLNATVARVHSMGLGFGLYGDRGPTDCAKNPGNLGHEVSDAEQYAGWEIDWYKTDSCSASGDHATAFKEYGAMRDALNKTGRQIWLALCGWNTWYAPPDPSLGYAGGKSLGNSWRTGPDTGSGWLAVLTNIDNGLSVSQYSGPSAAGGGWNDGSLQLNPGMGCRGSSHAETGPLPPDDQCMDANRTRSMYSAWCMLAMNLLLTGNFSALEPSTLETWSNPEILAINQDPLGQAAVRLNGSITGYGSAASTSLYASDSQTYVRAVMAECGGEPAAQQWVFGSNGMISRDASFTGTCLNVKGCDSDVIYDGCTNASTACGKNEEFVYGQDGTLKSMLPGSKCLTENSDKTLSISNCETGAKQWFNFTESGTFVDKEGLCLTYSEPPKPKPTGSAYYVMGRPLSGDTLGGSARAAASLPGGAVASKPGFALMFLSNEKSIVTVTCGENCLEQMGMDLDKEYTLRDVWSHNDVGTVGGSAGAKQVRVDLSPGGQSRVFRITPAA